MVVVDDTGEFAIHCLPGRGKRALWIHGYTMDSRIWPELWSRLPSVYHLGVDLPGHGATRPMDATDDLRSVARQILSLALKHNVSHLIGLSFGGMVALQMACDAPEAFASLTLGSPALSGGPQDEASQTCNVELTRIYRERGPGLWLRERWMKVPPMIFEGAARQPDLFRRLAGIINSHPFSELSDNRMQRFAQQTQSASEMRRIRSKTLVFVGENDMPAFKRSAELIRRAIPQCERVYLPDTGHLCLLESPDAVLPHLERHFEAANQAKA